MAPWLIAAVGVVYLVTAVALWSDRQVGLAIAFLGYAFANIGLYVVAKGG